MPLGSISGPTLGPNFFFSPDSNSVTHNYKEMKFKMNFFIKIRPSSLLLRFGPFVGHLLILKIFGPGIQIWTIYRT